MDTKERNAIFISHANPEDNEFTVWLGAKLSAAGYEVWADVLTLRGGQDWQRMLEDALKFKAFKVLMVGTTHGVKKQGVRNEIQIASNVSRDIGDQEFIIPLKLNAFDAPFLVVHAQHINFDKGWADGFVELLETLESYKVPCQISTESLTNDYWRNVHTRHSRDLIKKSEFLISNWLKVSKLPEYIYLYNFHSGVVIEAIEEKKSTSPIPLVSINRGFIGFGLNTDYEDHFGQNFPIKLVGRLEAKEFLKSGWPSQEISWFDANNYLSSLFRQGLEKIFIENNLTSYELSGTQLVWWGRLGSVPPTQISFKWTDLLSGRRQIIGHFKKRDIHWHYGISADFVSHPLPHIKLIGRVVFTEDGGRLINDPKKMHQLRRSMTRSWRNSKWRDMMLAFIWWLSKGGSQLNVIFGSKSMAVINIPPLQFESMISVQSAETEDVNKDSSEEESEDFFDDEEYDDEYAEEHDEITDGNS